MTELEQRHIARDSLFVMAGLRVAGMDKEFRVKIRNLSPGGLMAEGGPRVVRGTPVIMDIRNVGQVPGVVAWVQDARFGVAFDEEIDPKTARAGTGPAVEPPQFRPLPSVAQLMSGNGRGALRKV
ncbi:PilZ domain-containing protein [Novosphingobium sp. FSY-8]|uniref:PilZ domain-containing protein n=1 Tax=Novosphingobium ovatum TaxID=1908523 RepID=A0ABW9XGY5_9SPHN|nr:PilZ domain-containing protein [Novosphingobium ovatum]NBC37667.1 PilZ domain-containing protein [Novosphingobium ovatum]